MIITAVLVFGLMTGIYDGTWWHFMIAYVLDCGISNG